MNRPGFRRSSRGAPTASPTAVDSCLGAAPFSHAQIVHLMKSEFARARRHGHPLTCILVRVDRLERLVEYHGAELRDAIRQQLARLIAEKTRGHDHLGVLGEDRFLLVLPHADDDAGLVVAERLRDAFAGTAFEVQGSRLPVTISLGVAACGLDQATLFFDTMVDQAEVALEWAIQEGGDRAVLFRRDRFLTLESDVESADTRDPESSVHEDPAGRRREDDRRHARG